MLSVTAFKIFNLTHTQKKKGNMKYLSNLRNVETSPYDNIELGPYTKLQR